MNNTNITISEFALEKILSYSRESTNNYLKLNEALIKLSKHEDTFEVRKIKGFSRPLWSLALDDSYSIFFIYGIAKGDEEIRIVYFEEAKKIGFGKIKPILLFSGEILTEEGQATPLIQEVLENNCKPAFPGRIIEEATSLNSFLNPTEDELSNYLNECNFETDDLNGQPYRVLSSLQPPNDLPIRLSPQQEKILNAPLPILLQGVAGSGKTSIIASFAHREVLRSNNKNNVLIVAYTEQLKNFIVSIIQTLHSNNPIALNKITVSTWRDLCNELSKEIGLKSFLWAPETFFIDFLHLYIKNKKNIPGETFFADEIQEFIRGQIKGGNLNPYSELNREEFLSLKSTPLDQKIKRTELYDLIQHYQYTLETKGMVEDSDAAKKLLCIENIFKKYDFVLVDEVQDYTTIQIVLLANLAKRVDGLFFTGDMNQVLHPSYFSWDKVRSAIWKAWQCNPPEILDISYNYRNPQPIIDLSNVIIKLRANRLGIKETMYKYNSHVMNPRPIRLVTRQSDIDSLVIELATQIGSLAIIRPTGKSVQKINDNVSDVISIERNYTPMTSKGLEFNVVCLINFNDTYQDLVSSPKNNSEQQQLLKFNEVYVAITRTRSQLVILDRLNSSSGLWENHEISALIDRENNKNELIQMITSRFKNKSKEDWMIDALDFESQKAYAAAGECWERAGEMKNAASSYEKAGRWQKAINIYLSIEDYMLAANLYIDKSKYLEAAECYIKANELDLAAEMYKSQGSFAKTAETYKLIAEATNQKEYWEKSAEYFIKSKQFESASFCYIKTLKLAEAAKTYEKGKFWLKAAEIWKQVGDYNSSAICYSNFGDYSNSANCYMLSQNWHEASVAWEKIKNFEKSAECYTYMQNYIKAGFLYIKVGRFEDAIKCFQKNNNLAIAIKEFEKKSLYALCAECCLLINQIPEAIEYYLKDKHFEKAFECYANTRNWAEGIKSFSSIGQYHYAARCCENDSNFELAAKYYELSEQWENAAKIWKSLNRTDEVIICLSALNDLRGLAEINEEIDNWHEAALFWEEFGDLERFSNCMKKYTNLEMDAKYEESYKKWFKAGPIWEKAYQFDKAANCYILDKNFIAAADCYEKSFQWKRAIEIWAILSNKTKIEYCKDQYSKTIEIANYYESKGFWNRAAQVWINMAKNKRAMFCFSNSTNFSRYARFLEKNEHWLEAAEQWAKENRLENAIKCYVILDNSIAAFHLESYEQWEFAGKIWEKEGQFERAANCFNQSSNVLKMAEMFEKAKMWDDARICWESIGLVDRVAYCYSQIGKHNLAAINFENCDNLIEAAHQWELAKDFKQSLRCYQKIGTPKELSKIRSSSALWKISANKYEKIMDISGASFCYQVAGYMLKEKGRYKEASICFKKSDNKVEFLKCAIWAILFGSKK